MIKTAPQQALMRASGRLLAQVFDALDRLPLEGMSTLQANDWVERFIVDELQARPASKGQYDFAYVLNSSIDNVVCHGVPFHRRFQQDLPDRRGRAAGAALRPAWRRAGAGGGHDLHHRADDQPGPRDDRHERGRLDGHHLRWGILGAGIALDGEQRKWHLAGAREWYEQQPRLLPAQKPAP